MKLKNVHPEGRDSMWYFYCPGCEEIHGFRVEPSPGKGPIWSFDGNTERPTFNPSLLRRAGPYIEVGRELISQSICHLFLHNGRLQFLGDSTHKLAGQTVDLPDLPEKYQQDSYYQ